MSLSASAIFAARTHLSQGRRDLARSTLRKHLDRVPGDADAAKLLATIHQSFSEHDLAAACLARAALIHKADAELHYLLGRAQASANNTRAAHAAFETSIKLAPHEPLPYQGLAECLIATGEIPAALDTTRRCLSLNPHHPDAYLAHCTILARLSHFESAAATAGQGLDIAPDDVGLLQAAIYALNVLDCDPIEHTDLHRRLGRAVSAQANQNQLPRDPRTFTNSRDPHRPLTLALLSPDFHTHSCAFFLEGLIAALDRSQLSPILFSTTTSSDEVTDRFKSLAPFRDLSTLTESQALAQIAADAPDIMLDLAGWTSRQQMKLMSLRLAPLQGTYLGYPATTGIPAIDFRIVDEVTDPPSTDAHATEKLLRLPRCFLSYQPSSNVPPPKSAVASPDSGPRTQDPGPVFVSFNNISKLSPSTLSTWRGLLTALPSSRLLLKSPRLPDHLLAHHRSILTAAGIPDDRLTLLPFTTNINDHLALYHHADIALDPFPYHGTTTTCEALHMGIPVISLQGSAHRSRVGASLLHATNLPDLIATSPSDYIHKAITLANDQPRLSTLHATLRQHFSQSPARNHTTLARAFEQALRGQWQRWCIPPAP